MSRWRGAEKQKEETRIGNWEEQGRECVYSPAFPDSPRSIRLFQSPSLLISGSGNWCPLARFCCRKHKKIYHSRFALVKKFQRTKLQSFRYWDLSLKKTKPNIEIWLESLESELFFFHFSPLTYTLSHRFCFPFVPRPSVWSDNNLRTTTHSHFCF